MLCQRHRLPEVKHSTLAIYYISDKQPIILLPSIHAIRPHTDLAYLTHSYRNQIQNFSDPPPYPTPICKARGAALG